MAALSFRLSEGNLRIVSNAEADLPKTKSVAPMMKQFDEEDKILLLTEENLDDNFEKGSRNLKNLVVKPASVRYYCF